MNLVVAVFVVELSGVKYAAEDDYAVIVVMVVDVESYDEVQDDFDVEIDVTVCDYNELDVPRVGWKFEKVSGGEYGIDVEKQLDDEILLGAEVQIDEKLIDVVIQKEAQQIDVGIQMDEKQIDAVIQMDEKQIDAGRQMDEKLTGAEIWMGEKQLDVVIQMYEIDEERADVVKDFDAGIQIDDEKSTGVTLVDVG